jgi:hypothetical protein
LNTKADVEMDNLHVRRITIKDLVNYIYIIRVDSIITIPILVLPLLVADMHVMSKKMIKLFAQHY